MGAGAQVWEDRGRKSKLRWGMQITGCDRGAGAEHGIGSIKRAQSMGGNVGRGVDASAPTQAQDTKQELGRR